MALQYSPKIVQDGLVMCLDPSQNKSYPTTDLPVKGGLLLWLDASDDSSFSYSSGTEVSQWRDKSGNNFHANQATVANQPSRNSIINSRKGVNFTSVNGDFMRVSSGIVTPNYITLFAVVKPATQDNSYAIIMEQDHGNGYNGWVIQRNGATSYWLSWVAGNAVTWLNPNQIAYTDNTSQIVTLRKNASTINLYSSGTSSGAASISDSTITQSSYGLNLGYWQYGGGRYYNGTMCEILVFNRGLSDTELKQVNTYLGQKWGISNTDRSVIDLSGFNDNGLLGNGTAANMPVYDYYNKGAFRFNGSNNFIQYPSLLNLGSIFTINFWIKPTSNTRQTIISNGYPYLANKGFFLVCPGNNSTDLFLSLGNDQKSVQSNTGAITTGVVQMVTAVANGAVGLMKLYVNGSEVSYAVQQNADISLQYDNGIFVTGKRDTTSADYLSSNLYSLQIYNKALTAAEILQNYEAQKSRFADSIVQQGLVLNIDAANPYSYGGAGTTVYDTSNTALSWTATNVTYNTDPIKYFSFNGSNSSLVSSTSTAYDSQTITMECWCYPNSLNQLGFLFEKGAVNTQYSMFFENANFQFRTFGLSNQDVTISSASYMTVSAWNHIVCTYASGTKITYINGAQAGGLSGITGTLNTGGTNQYIGKYGAAGDNYPFNGRIAESRVYNIALSAAQVLQNYNATRAKYGR
jgi:hypothetical protein